VAGKEKKAVCFSGRGGGKDRRLALNEKKGKRIRDDAVV